MFEETYDVGGEIKWEGQNYYVFFDGTCEVVLPKFYKDGCPLTTVRKVSGGHIFTMPMWLARKKGFVD